MLTRTAEYPLRAVVWLSDRYVLLERTDLGLNNSYSSQLSHSRAQALPRYVQPGWIADSLIPDSRIPG